MTETERPRYVAVSPAIVTACGIVCIVVGALATGHPGTLLRAAGGAVAAGGIYLAAIALAGSTFGAGIVGAAAAIVAMFSVLGTRTHDVHGARLAFLTGLVLIVVAAGMIYTPAQRSASSSHSAEGKSKNGKRHGEWEIYEGSQLVRTEVYDEGRLLRWTNWDEAGRPIDSGEGEPAPGAEESDPPA